MLTQNFQRKDAKKRRRKEKTNFIFATLPLCVFALNIFLSSCATKPTDMRSLVPAETLVYLETNDLAAALQPIVDSKPFTEVAKRKPDLSALKGVQLAVAVTGFETSEEKVNDEQSVGRIQPRFVAVADTHAWNYQAVAFAEQKLGSFVEDIYDSEPKLEKSDKHGGKYFVWTATDGRKAYALVIDNLIYFGNDESAIDKALAVRRGEADSITKINKIQPADAQTLASGYVSTDGVAQIAALIGVKFASESKEDSELQTAIVDVLPQLIRSSITDISWSAAKSEQGMEDKFVVEIPPIKSEKADEILSEIAESIIEDIEDTLAQDVVNVLAEKKSEDGAKPNTIYSKENRLTQSRVERRTVSDLGFIGWIISQFSQE